MDGRRFVPPGALIAGRECYLCVRRVLSEFGDQTAGISLADTRPVRAKLAERSGDVWMVCKPNGQGRAAVM
jgi:hypothetical protein